MLEYTLSVRMIERENLVKDKKRIRKMMKSFLKNMGVEERERRSRDVKEKLLSLGIYKKAKTILFYASREDEVDTFSIMREALKASKRVLLPRIEGEDLRIYEIKNLDRDLEKGVYDIFQPKKNRPPVENLKEIEVVVVPGLAFDREKNRLGRGKGYYDRFLKRLPSDTLKIGICFSFQLLDCLPHTSDDFKLDKIITDREII